VIKELVDDRWFDDFTTGVAQASFCDHRHDDDVMRVGYERQSLCCFDSTLRGLRLAGGIELNDIKLMRRIHWSAKLVVKIQNKCSIGEHPAYIAVVVRRHMNDIVANITCMRGAANKLDVKKMSRSTRSWWVVPQADIGVDPDLLWGVSNYMNNAAKVSKQQQRSIFSSKGSLVSLLIPYRFLFLTCQ
jgi:hypothetical protein